jgi:hypothetical protein
MTRMAVTVTRMVTRMETRVAARAGIRVGLPREPGTLRSSRCAPAKPLRKQFELFRGVKKCPCEGLGDAASLHGNKGLEDCFHFSGLIVHQLGIPLRR